MATNRLSGEIEPDLIFRGFTLDEVLIEECKRVIESVIRNFGEKTVEREEIKSAVRKAVKKFIFSRTRKAPMILPVIAD